MELTQKPPVSGFAADLARLRRAATLSQRGVAKRAGLTPAYISLLEGGRRAPERPTVERLAAALDLSANERARLIRSAGYVADPPPVAVPVAGRDAATAPPVSDSLLHDAESLLASAKFPVPQRDLAVTLITAYTGGLIERVRAGLPLVSDLAAPWQRQILAAIDERVRGAVAEERRLLERPIFDL